MPTWTLLLLMGFSHTFRNLTDMRRWTASNTEHFLLSNGHGIIAAGVRRDGIDGKTLALMALEAEWGVPNFDKDNEDVILDAIGACLDDHWSIFQGIIFPRAYKASGHWTPSSLGGPHVCFISPRQTGPFSHQTNLLASGSKSPFASSHAPTAASGK